MAATKKIGKASTNGRVSLDPATHAPGHPAGPGMYLHWEGRKGYRTRMPAPRMLEPIPKLSFGKPRDNRVIEGDNLQAMVSLRSQYQGMVDVAYLDVPYNTGKKDFAYSDARFHDPNADADDMVYVNNEDGGRHTKWLNFIGPRLWLVWQLLAEHGICFVSINDIELFRLGMLMDEIFGEQNHIATMIWKQGTDNNPTRVAVEHEYILCYAKRVEDVPRTWAGHSQAKEWMLAKFAELEAKQPDRGKLAREWKAVIREHVKAMKTAIESADVDAEGEDAIDLGSLARYDRVDERGAYASIRNTDNPGKPGYFYDVIHPITGKPCAKPATGYRFSEERMKQLLAEDMIVFGKDEKKLIELKKYLKDVKDPLRSVIELDGRAAANLLKKLLPGEGPARYYTAKPVELIEKLVAFAGDDDALVLDAFAGSGTTGHAVMRLNAADGGSRRFILIEEGTNDEPYCRTLLAPRLKAAIQQETLPGGFTFETTGRRLNRSAILELQREAIANLIVHTDATGKGRGITRVAGEYVIGQNPRGEAICLRWNGRKKSAITREVLVAMFEEAKTRGLRKPIRAYAATCEIGETDSFRFCQIPDEILAALQIEEGEDAALAGDADAVEALEAAVLGDC
jgi:adenine-specific DNA-methyltransferase